MYNEQLISAEFLFNTVLFYNPILQGGGGNNQYNTIIVRTIRELS